MGHFIVTGGGSGIGQALAWRLAELGHTVMVSGRREDCLATTKAHNPELINIIASDLATTDGRAALCHSVIGWPSIDGLIHNAGTVEPVCPISELSLSDWKKVMATNVEAPLFLTKALLPQLVGGRILHLSSGLRELAMRSLAPYSVSKAALYMLYQCMNVEFDTVAVGSIKPGIVDTAMQGELREAGALPADDRGFYQALKTRDQLVSPAAVALMMSWLLLEVDEPRYSAQEWDIYDTTHHNEWLVNASVPELKL